jgi:hypothetical protein
MLRMLGIMSKEAKKYIGNIGVENIFYKQISNHEGCQGGKVYMGQLHVSEPQMQISIQWHEMYFNGVLEAP